MCGIAGTVNLPLSFEKLKPVMLHRGPDAQETFTQDNVSFGHFRLSILDIEGGAQPMHLNNELTIIFNGQIYNHLSLREQFGLQGNTRSDTETLLLLYKKMGHAMLPYLDGMFVFAIFDHNRKTIFLARDRAGKKPLYIYQHNNTLAFASELNGIKAICNPGIREGYFNLYTRLGVFYRTLTPYQHTEELEAGTYCLIQTQPLSVEKFRWFNIHDQYLKKNNDTFDTALHTVDNILHESVKSRLLSSDLEVGCFLSGGIDSGLVTSIASGYTSSLKTFTVSFPDTYDEAPLAALVAQRYGTQHTELTISFDHLKQDIEKIILNYGEPFFDSSAIPSYYVSREAKKHLTVILNGDGADELFGGYRRYVPFSKFDFFKQGAAFRAMARGLFSVLPHPHEKKSKYNFLYRLVQLASKKNVDIYFAAGLDILEGYEHHLIQPHSPDLEMIQHDFEKIAQSEMSGLKKIMNMDFDCNLFSDLLVKMDIATMSHSLEGRSPFLCKDFLEYVPGMPDAYKIKGTTTKYLLRELAKKYLPETLIHQPKRGFEIPLKSWVNGVLKEMIHDYILSPGALNPTILKKDFTQQLVDGRIRMPAEKRAKILWMLFCMEVWYQKNHQA
ncbi:MAG TPA: asparagine synthase (glutamine-hydrolyzing) [Ferruginibacter sp.]|nr:asparagine synthase (glutamine-hydrolyzing) [Ferruginibacter sp.]HRO05963.1 asparagine synthase (glutamine-hydrolyzing) [Ferruginibacter sp.]HRO97220.1 asparagine synthase (glutamine-hydrolyzing) [Ferruginibacter sp.]HRP49049.1 asparagine synthase (glutamine-hydrolyzing) [Ferruginibacter sp.]